MGKSTMEHQHQGNSVYSSPKPKIPARGDPVVQAHQGNPVHSYFSPKHKIPAGGDPVTAPTSNDVLSGRGGAVNGHCGNVRLRTIVHSMKVPYLSPRIRKLQKTVSETGTGHRIVV